MRWNVESNLCSIWVFESNYIFFFQNLMSFLALKVHFLILKLMWNDPVPLPASLCIFQPSWLNPSWWVCHTGSLYICCSNNSFQISMYKVYLAMTAITCKILGAMKHYHWFHVLQSDNDMFPVHKYGASSVSRLCLLRVRFPLEMFSHLCR